MPCTRTIILPCIFMCYLPITIYFFIMDVCPAISWKVQKGLKLNLVYK